ncbi:MAG: hypothetical protein ACRCXT_18280 [Paraclostridium sp.]
MSGFIAGLGTYNISTENEITSILSHFNTQYILDIMRDNITQKYASYNIETPNIVSSFDTYFKHLKNIYTSPDDQYRIEETRINTYNEIINIICNSYNIEFNSTDIQDYYTVTYYLYDLFVARYNTHIINFFANFIIKERNTIYDSLSLNDYKKNKDSLTIYNKKLYKNPKLAIINANINMVLSILYGYDIPFNNILNIIYNYDKNIVRLISSCISPKTDFYKSNFVNTIQTSPISPLLLTNIRFSIQSQSVNMGDLNIIDSTI